MIDFIGDILFDKKKQRQPEKRTFFDTGLIQTSYLIGRKQYCLNNEILLKFDCHFQARLQVESIIKINMSEKKELLQNRTNNHVWSSHSPSSHRNKSPLTLSSNDSHRSPSGRSSSKGHKTSAHKLFEKAHLANQGETYLYGLKRQKERFPRPQEKSAAKMTMGKTKSLGVYKEYEIKLSGQQEDGHYITHLIQDFDEPFPLWSGDISSINEGVDGRSEVESDSLLRAIN